MNGAVRLAIVGAAGRMGRRVIARAARQPDLRVTALVERERAELGGELPAGAVLLGADPQAIAGVADVVIDFSAPPACATWLPVCAQHGIGYLVASTALESAHQQAIAAASGAIAVVVASNLSLGVNVLAQLVEQAARSLGGTFDIEIAEIHHRGKRDAPSGTALALAAAAERGRGELRRVLGRAGSEPPRDPGQLGIAALRGGDVSGEHTVFLLGEGERLELTHRATSPDIFAEGALRAARWLVRQPPGRYGMADLLAGPAAPP